MKKDLSISMRVIFAALSGLGVALMMTTDLSIATLGEGLLFYSLSGLCFAAGVLYPYVANDKFRLARIVVIIAASAVSFWLAVNLAIGGPWSGMVGRTGSSTMAFILSSFAGAAVVMIALLPAGPVTLSRSYVLYGIAAALLGGVIASRTMESNSFLVMSIGFICWHLLVSLAIYLAVGNKQKTYQPMP